jgi:hypothetical protein
VDNGSDQRIVSIRSAIALSNEAASIPQKKSKNLPLTFKDRQRDQTLCD